MTAKAIRKYSFHRRQQQWPGVFALGIAVMLGLLLAWLPVLNIFVFVGGLAIVLLTVIQPLFGLGLALLVGPFGALEQLLSGSSSLDSGQAILFFSFAAWIARGLARRRLTLPHSFLNVPFLIVIGVGLMSLLSAESVETGLREVVKWVEMLLIVLLVVDLGGDGLHKDNERSKTSLLGRPPRTVWIVSMLLFAGVSQALIGVWQFGLRGDGPEHFMILDRFYRAYGTFEQPNPFGGYMNLTALLAIGVLVGLVLVWRKERGDEGWKTEDEGFSSFALRRSSTKMLLAIVLVAFVAILTSLALLFSWSRGAWLGFAAGLAAMVLFFPRKRVYGVLLVGLGLALLLAALASGRLPSAIAVRITGFAQDFRLGDVRGVDINDDNYSVLERQAHWQAGLDMLNENVLLGVGFGNYAVAYPDYALINWPDPLGHAHNYYINLLAEVGVLGLAAYVLFWSAVFWQTIRLLRQLDWPGRGVVLGLMGVWIALTIHHLVDKLFVNNIYIHLGVLFGLLQLIYLDKNSKVGGLFFPPGLDEAKGQ